MAEWMVNTFTVKLSLNDAHNYVCLIDNKYVTFLTSILAKEVFINAWKWSLFGCQKLLLPFDNCSLKMQVAPIWFP